MTVVLPPRVVVAGTSSGVGKTTVATGLLAALARRGARVGAAKVGPDFIDPGYHTLAAGRPSRNLDAWICGPEAVAPLAARAGQGCDVVVVEGVMGLFDGADGEVRPGHPPQGSTAEAAVLLDAPVLLVVDASAQAASVAALVHGFATFDPTVRIAAIVLNRVASDSHEEMLRTALAATGVPVLGVLRRDDALTWRDRHLGLVPVVEDPAGVTAALDRLAGRIDDGIDLDAVVRLARTAPATSVGTLAAPSRVVDGGPPPVVAVAGGPAFSFCYPDNVEALGAAGAEVVAVDPLADEALPAGARALVAGGGFPEVFAADLAANRPLLADLRRRAADGLVMWAECGGLLWLGTELDGNRLAGIVPAAGTMTGRLTLGYRQARTRTATPFGPAGTELRGHEFHYSALTPPGGALELWGRAGATEGGYASPTMLASYLHLHLGTRPELAERFVATAATT